MSLYFISTIALADDVREYLERRDIADNSAVFVGIVFPAITGVDPTDTISNIVLSLAVRGKTTSMDGKRFLGYSVFYPVKAPLALPQHKYAASLARANGMQATVWSIVEEYSYGMEYEGYASFPRFSYSNIYEDFRQKDGVDLRLENWIITHNGKTMSVGIPSNFVELPPYIIEKEIYEDFKNGDICAHIVGSAKCINFLDMGPTRLLRINSSSGKLIFSKFENKTKYEANIPKQIFADNETVAYIATFINYCRGNWTKTIEQAAVVLNGRNSTRQMKRDALLYSAGAKFRSGIDGSVDLEHARQLGELSAMVSKYKIMAAFLKLKSNNISESLFLNIIDKEARLVEQEWLDKNDI